MKKIILSLCLSLSLFSVFAHEGIWIPMLSIVILLSTVVRVSSFAIKFIFLIPGKNRKIFVTETIIIFLKKIKII